MPSMFSRNLKKLQRGRTTAGIMFVVDLMTESPTSLTAVSLEMKVIVRCFATGKMQPSSFTVTDLQKPFADIKLIKAE